MIHGVFTIKNIIDVLDSDENRVVGEREGDYLKER